jgi:hypothetical protein
MPASARTPIPNRESEADSGVGCGVEKVTLSRMPVQNPPEISDKFTAPMGALSLEPVEVIIDLLTPTA